MIHDTSAHAWALLTQNLTDRQKEVLDWLRYFLDYEHGTFGEHELDREPDHWASRRATQDRTCLGRREAPMQDHGRDESLLESRASSLAGSIR